MFSRYIAALAVFILLFSATYELVYAAPNQNPPIGGVFEVNQSAPKPSLRINSGGDIDLGAWKATAVGISYGGTGATQTGDTNCPGPSCVTGARTNIGAAASGANSDITSLSPTGDLILTPTGNVGIGVTSTTSGAKLQIGGLASNKQIFIGEYGTNGLTNTNFVGTRYAWDTDNLQIGLRDYGADRKDAVFNIEQSGDNFRFQVAGSDILFLSGTGNLGVGTTSPGSKLDVDGNIRSRGSTLNIWGPGSGSEGAQINLADPATRADGQTGAWSIDNNNNQLRIMDDGSVKLQIDTSGRVGIGTTSPGARLNVIPSGTIGAAGDLQNAGLLVGTTTTGIGIDDNEITQKNGDLWLTSFSGATRIRTGTTERLTILNNGNVGIGTTGPSGRLHVVTPAGAQSPSNALIVGGDSSGDMQMRIGRSASVDQYVWIQSTETAIAHRDLVLNPSGGNVGIGTTSISHKLDVSGTGRFTGTVTVGTPIDGSHAATKSYVDSASGGGVGSGIANQTLRHNGTSWVGSSALVNDGTNVGIGTTSPTAAKLVISAPASGGITSYINLDGQTSAPDLNLRVGSDGTHNGSAQTITSYGRGTGSQDLRFEAGNWGGSYTWGLGSLAGQKVIAEISSSGGGSTGTTHDGRLSLYSSTDAQIGYSGGGGAGTVNVRISSSGLSWFNGGNVGIGTTGPVATLTTTKSGSASYPTPGQSVANSALHIKPSTTTAGHSSAITFGAVDTASGDNAQAGIYVQSSGGYGTKMYFATTNSYATGAQSRVMIDHRGFMGINRIDPGYNLDVNGIGRFTGTVVVATPTDDSHAATMGYVKSSVGGGVGTGTTNQTLRHNGTGWVGSSVLVNDGTNVGIGTTSPGSTLDVGGTSLTAQIQNLSTWGLNARTQGLIIMPEGDVKDDGAGNLTIPTTIIMNPLSGSWIRVLAGTYNLGTWGSLWTAIPPAGARGTTVTPTVLAWADADRNYDGRDRVLLAQRQSGGPIYTRFGVRANYTGNSGAYFGGNVGISTTSPDYKLDVNGTGRFTSTVIVGTPTDAGHAATKSYVDSASGGGVGTGTANQTLRHNGTGWVGSSVLVNNGTNVGIGTTSPQYVLDVATPSNSFASIGATMGVGSFSGLHFGYREATNNLYRKSAIVFERTDNSGGGGNAAGKVHILNGPAIGSGSATLADAKLTINELGNVGIGDTTPDAKLDIEGEVRISSGNYLTFGNDDATSRDFGLRAEGENLFIREPEDGNKFYAGFYDDSRVSFGVGSEVLTATASNVGVGNSGPSYKLDVNGSGRFTSTVIVGTPTDAGHAATKSYVDSASGGGVGAGTANQTLRHSGTGWVASSVLVNDGTAIGINNSAPYSDSNVRLDVSGGISSTNVIRNRIGSALGSWRDDGAILNLPWGRVANRNPDFLMDTIGDKGTSYPIGWSRYNNAGGSTLTASVMSENTAPNSSGKMMRISYDGGGSTSPGFGGFILSTSLKDGSVTGFDQYKRGTRIYYVVWAKIPVGRNIQAASNGTGDGGGDNWLTPRAGTGKWERYVRVRTVGETGTLSGTGHFYIEGGSNTAFTWDVSSGYTIMVDEDYPQLATSYLNIGHKPEVALGWGQLLTTSSTYLATNGGNVGIGKASADYRLDVSGTARFTGTVVVATPTDDSHAATQGYVKSAVGGGTSVNSAACSADAVCEMNGANLNGGNIVGINKITVQTIDPIYEINDKKYATYVSDTIGLKMEYYGKANLLKKGDYYQYDIDFKNADEGSDFWLFWQTIDEGKNMKDIIVSLTPEGGWAKLWYEVDHKNKRIVIKGDRKLSVSYHLVAPRHDAKEWPTLMGDTEERGAVLEEKK